jgi:ubiquinone/menaquinone biosynthesis C-methylase UbiE
MRIEIGRRHYLAYLLLSHPAKIARLSSESRTRLDEINRAFNERIYSGEGAREYDRIHRYAEAERSDADQNDYPARALVDETWVGAGYGRALELGAGSGYFTTLIARHAKSVVAIEPVPDIRVVLAERCRREGLEHVQVLGATALDLPAHVGEASIDSAFVIQSLHHFHRRDEVFRALGRVVRPGGRLFLVEPHHNLRRVARLTRKYLAEYRATSFWQDERNWATHDFLTRGELRALCRQGGFTDVSLEGYWIPGSRRLIVDPRRRFGLERLVGRLPALRHFAMVLALTARREGDRSG